MSRTVDDESMATESRPKLERKNLMAKPEENEKLLSELRTLMHDAKDLLDATTDQTDAKIGEIRTRMTATLDSAQVTYRKFQSRLSDATRVADDTIRKHTYESIGTALGIGLVIGVLLGRA